MTDSTERADRPQVPWTAHPERCVEVVGIATAAGTFQISAYMSKSGDFCVPLRPTEWCGFEGEWVFTLTSVAHGRIAATSTDLEPLLTLMDEVDSWGLRFDWSRPLDVLGADPEWGPIGRRIHEALRRIESGGAA